VRRTLLALAVCGLLTLTGCTIPVIGASSAKNSTSSTTSKAKGPWTTVQRSDPPRPSPTPAPYVPSPTPAFLVLSPQPTAKASPYPSPSVVTCTSNRQPGGTLTPAVTLSGTTATVTWWHDGDARVSAYRVTPALQVRTPSDGQKPLVWTTVKPGTGCHQLSATLTGLARGSSYEIWLDTVTVDPLYPGRSVDLMVGRTQAVTIG
jgi:hypothetical protein